MAASILGISRSLAYELIGRGEFPVPTVRLGSRILVPVRPLLALLEGRDEEEGDRGE
ncbi:helix-turn-helix transcriptional regulator [Nocardioides taihuensis]|uniref:Helix-turn-helix transcriptional regulator n=1 Tax=Nocardioides taihuensis TaxID=1835606 RepID=A0ABW0BQD9_9ACTN